MIYNSVHTIKLGIEAGHTIKYSWPSIEKVLKNLHLILESSKKKNKILALRGAWYLKKTKGIVTNHVHSDVSKD